MKLAIKGNPKRSKEVIKILEMLGGVNKYYIINTEENLLYCLREIDNVIIATYPNNSITVLTIEEFIEKYPYKIGDKVIYTAGIGFISKVTWDNEDDKMLYEVKVGNTSWLTDAKHLQPYKEESINKANKVVFDTNAQCCDIMSHLIKEESMGEIIKIDIPKGYEFAGVDDDNQQVVFEKIGYQYPKTYEECCKVLFPNSLALGKVLASGYNCELLERLGKLLICRDAYWKIAGEQMGLGKSWEPDCRNAVYGIFRSSGIIKTQDCFYGNTRVLEFPTAEMRDAFYENFKELIEECKELL